MAKDKRQYKGNRAKERGNRIKHERSRGEKGFIGKGNGSGMNNSSVNRLGKNQGPLSTMDGYAIPEANIGIPGYNLLSRGVYTAGRLTENQQLLTTLYRENWIVKRIVDTPAEDMTKKWYKINSALAPKKVEELRREERRHSIQKEMTDAIKWARLYGGAGALMVIKGQEDMMDQPLNLALVMPGDFKGLYIIDRVTGIEPSVELVEDLDDPDFGLPLHYSITFGEEQVKVHHTRLLRFVGRELPQQETACEGYWGASEIEHVYSELQKRDAASANIGQLMFQANLKVQKMKDLGEVLTTTSPKQRERVLGSIAYQNFLASSFGTLVLSDQDSYETHPYSFGGVSEVYQQFKMDIAGAAEMPATKLFGQSPDGMNATGESDIINYNEAIAQKQENMLRGPLERLLPVMCMSLWGKVPEDLEIAFESIGTLTEDEKSAIAGRDVSTIASAFQAGMIGKATALMELKKTGQAIGRWDSITDEALDLAKEEEEQAQIQQEQMGAMAGGPMGMMGGTGDIGGMEDMAGPEGLNHQKALTQDALIWKEHEHPRHRDGKFREKGGAIRGTSGREDIIPGAGKQASSTKSTTKSSNSSSNSGRSTVQKSGQKTSSLSGSGVGGGSTWGSRGTGSGNNQSQTIKRLVKNARNILAGFMNKEFNFKLPDNEREETKTSLLSKEELLREQQTLSEKPVYLVSNTGIHGMGNPYLVKEEKESAQPAFIDMDIDLPKELLEPLNEIIALEQQREENAALPKSQKQEDENTKIVKKLTNYSDDIFSYIEDNYDQMPKDIKTFYQLAESLISTVKEEDKTLATAGQIKRAACLLMIGNRLGVSMESTDFGKVMEKRGDLNTGNIGMLPGETFMVASNIQMVVDRWRYTLGGMDWEQVDCQSVPRISAEKWYKKQIYQFFDKVGFIRQDSSDVYDWVKKHIGVEYVGQIKRSEGDEGCSLDDLVPAMALLDDDGGHVGDYVGKATVFLIETKPAKDDKEAEYMPVSITDLNGNVSTAESFKLNKKTNSITNSQVQFVPADGEESSKEPGIVETRGQIIITVDGVETEYTGMLAEYDHAIVHSTGSRQSEARNENKFVRIEPVERTNFTRWSIYGYVDYGNGINPNTGRPIMDWMEQFYAMPIKEEKQ